MRKRKTRDEQVETAVVRADVVQARRVELLDDRGVLRGVAGELSWRWDDGSHVHGLELYDESGQPRLCAVLTPIGPSLTMSAGGAVVLAVGHDDPVETVQRPGSHIRLMSPGGQVAGGWWVNADVQVIGEGGFRW